MSLVYKAKKFVSDMDNQKRYAAWILKHARPHRRKVFAVLVAGILNALAGILLSLLVKQLIDGAQSGNWDIKILAVYAGLLIFSEVLVAVWDYIAVVYDQKVCMDLRERLYSSIIGADWLTISAYRSGDLVTRLTADIDKISDGITDTLPSILSFMVQLAVTFAVLVIFSPVIALVSLVAGMIGMLLTMAVKSGLYRLQLRTQEAESTISSHLTESVENIEPIQCFCGEEHMKEDLKDYHSGQLSSVKDKAKANSRTSFAINLAFQVAYLFAFGASLLFLSKGQISFGTLTMILVLAGYVQAPLVNIAKSIPRVIWMLASGGRLMEIESLGSEDIVENLSTLPDVGLCFENISFSYGSKKVLDGLDLTINSGETVGIIGRSGCGKTTMIRLIMALLKPQSGSISFFNSSEKVPASRQTRHFMGFVPQGNTLLSGTIARNIRFGADQMSEEVVARALEIAEASDFIEELEYGVETEIGESGIGLSEGQAQRIAIARSIARVLTGQASFIILDEATSALDTITEQRILDNLARMENRPACLIITHRLQVLDICDRVIEIQNGKAIERKPT